MNNKTKDAHVVVMGPYTAGLSIARSLGRRGIKVIGVSSARHPATYSRFVTYQKEPHTETENERVNFFLNLGLKFKSPPVILSLLDPDVMFLSRNRDVLEKYFLFFLPPHKLLKSLTSKNGLIEIANRLKIALPFCIRVNKPSDLKKIPSSFYPCVLKPEFQEIWATEKAYKIGIGKLKVIPANNKLELLKQYERVREVENNLIVQKMIVGPDENHLSYRALIDSDGHTIAEFVGKKLRLTPPHFGMGCYVESIKSDEVISEGRRILRLLDYRGLAEIDFKRDERDGRLYFFELNPRFGFWIGLDVACGLDFPYYYYKLCLGEKIIPTDGYILGKKWLSLYHDIKGIRPLLKDGSLTWHQWILSVIKADLGPIYAFDDPLPTISLFFQIFNNLLKRVNLRIRRS